MAPKVSKQRRDDAEGSVLEALAAQSPGDPAARQQEPPAQDATNGKPQLSPTEQLILNELERTRRELDTIRGERSMREYVPPQVPQLPDAPKPLDLSNLPDPVTQSAMYNTELAKRVQAHYDATRAYERRVEEVQRTSASTREEAANGIWEDFQIQYPELSEHEDRVQFVAQKVVDAAAKRGIDRERYIFGNSQRFLADVAREYENIFGSSNEPDGSPDEPMARRASPNDDTGRTGGIFGGQQSGGAPARGAEAPGDMIRELQDRQRKSGFF